MHQDGIDASVIGSIYDEFGDYYHQSRKDRAGRFSNEFIDVPTLLSLLEQDLTNKRALDAGCGSGIVAQLVAAKGAKVDGVDASSRMIEIAQADKPDELNISYAVGDISQLLFPDSTFDLIVCNYVLENVEAIDDVFGEFRRVLRSDGRAIFSISHPLRACTVKSEQAGEEVWILRDYFNHDVRRSDFGGGMVVPKYRRTVADYAAAINSSGFVINQLIEPQPITAGEVEFPELFMKAMRLPQLLTVEIIPKP